MVSGRARKSESRKSKPNARRRETCSGKSTSDAASPRLRHVEETHPLPADRCITLLLLALVLDGLVQALSCQIRETC